MKRRLDQIVIKLKAQLFSGMTAEKWAASACFGIIAALFPVIGPVTLVSVGICWLARFHLPLVLILLYGLYPLQLALIVPFTWLGSLFTGWQLTADFALDDIFNASKRLGKEAFYWGISAVTGWLIISLPLSFGLYRLLLRYAQKLRETSV